MPSSRTKLASKQDKTTKQLLSIGKTGRINRMRLLDAAQERRDIIVHSRERAVRADVGDLTSGSNLAVSISATGIAIR